MKYFCQIINESIFYVGTGIFGLAAVICRGSMRDMIKYVGITSLTIGSILFLIRERNLKQVGRRNVVFITGCDSGLGKIGKMNFNSIKMC
jgi:hypothetical protein